MPPRRPLPTLLCVVLIAVGASGCGDDGPTTTSATTPSALQAQGARGGSATATAPSPGPLERYALDGPTASASTAAPVRRAFAAFARAVLRREARAACAQTVGFEELLRARGQQGTCERLLPGIGNTSAGPSQRDVDLISSADVVVAGDRATISVGSASPVPMRRVDGAWKLDYAAFAAAPKGR